MATKKSVPPKPKVRFAEIFSSGHQGGKFLIFFLFCTQLDPTRLSSSAPNSSFSLFSAIFLFQIGSIKHNQCGEFSPGICDENSGAATRRRVATRESLPSPTDVSNVASVDMDSAQINEAALTASGNKRWKRIMLLIIAITVHNIPGKLYAK
jgi:zinc transporter ZupT